MLFNSYLFIFLFFPLFVAGFFLLSKLQNKTVALWFLTAMSLVFYGYNHVRYVPVIVASILVNYAVSRALCRTADAEVLKRRLLLAAGIVFDLGLIFYFKYYDFFFENVNAAFHTRFQMKHLLLPLGISFFTFQQISFVVDSWRGETKDYGFAEYAAFVTFFPQLVAGPIVLHRELIPQYRDVSKRRVNWDNLYEGAVRFSLGLFKKVMIADTFGKAVAWGFANTETATGGDLMLVMLSYTFQIYFDFSGYSDMATGLAQMVNLQLPVNFDSPYKAFSVREFWKRWHMTLTRFLTAYVYLPLGGSRRGTGRTYVNMLVVFLLSGIWHGANWTFILWGVLHGLLCVGERLAGSVQKRLRARNGHRTDAAAVHPAVGWLYTFLAVNVLWLLFRADSVTQWVQMIKRIGGLQSLSLSGGLLSSFVLPEQDALFKLLFLRDANLAVRGFPMALFVCGALVLCLCFENNVRRKTGRNVRTALLAAGAFTWSVLSLGTESVFLYFNF